MVFNLSTQNSIANEFLFALRDSKIQQDRMRFRRNVERLGEIMAYEISKNLLYEDRTAVTSLGKATMKVLQEQPVLISIMRAGLPYFQGFINFFDHAEAGFVGAYRNEVAGDLTIELEYVATPVLNGKEIIIIDPMLATGKSVINTLKALLKQGIPKHIHIAALIVAPEGIDFLQKSLTLPYSIWTCATDEKLNEQFYIVPGLGDAGDLSYGQKI
jgi:uracil phosphoribosyltransferase